MAVLSRAELSELNPEKIFNISTFVLHYELWSNLNQNFAKILNKPVRIKFDENIRKSLGAIKNKKGVYIFLVEPDFPFLPKINYLMYVGRVIKTDTFFIRFYDYIKAIGNKNVRRNIQLLTNLWEGKTWVYFYALNLNDNEISDIEQSLYDNIIPPLNNQFRAKRTKNSRSIYN